MREQKLHPDIRVSKWAKVCQVIAVSGFFYCVLATISIHLSSTSYRLGFALLYLTPALFVVAPVELLIFLITIQSWNRWANRYQRATVITCSSGVILLLMIVLQLF